MTEPAAWRCPRCKYTNFITTGAVQCPNDGQWLEPVTEPAADDSIVPGYPERKTYRVCPPEHAALQAERDRVEREKAALKGLYDGLRDQFDAAQQRAEAQREACLEHQLHAERLLLRAERLAATLREVVRLFDEAYMGQDGPGSPLVPSPQEVEWVKCAQAALAPEATP